MRVDINLEKLKNLSATIVNIQGHRQLLIWHP